MSRAVVTMARQPTLAGLQAALTREEAARDHAGSLVSFYEAQLPSAVLEPDRVRDLLTKVDAAKTEKERAEKVIALLAPQLPALEQAERLAAFEARRAELERSGRKRSATWRRRYEEAAGALAAVLREMREDDEARTRLRQEAAELGAVGLTSAEASVRPIRSQVARWQSLADAITLPAFDHAAPVLWQGVRR